MNNMKSNVCRKANALIASGLTRSQAFTKAWALVKADAITEEMNWMDGTDRMNNVQLNQYRELAAQRTVLWNKANSIKTAAEIEAEQKAQAAAAAKHQEEQEKRFALMDQWEELRRASVRKRFGLAG